PDFGLAWNNLGSVLEGPGDVAESIACFRKALQLGAHPLSAGRNLLLRLHSDPSMTPEQVFAEHRDLGERIARPVAGFIRAHANERSPERRLRIGYVSPDFYDHVIAFFIEPMLAHHDRERFEIFCYQSGD